MKALYDELWKGFNEQEAERQGWGLFQIEGEELQLQRLDDRGIFEGDAEAWEHVYKESVKGDMTAITAFAILFKENKKEIARIKKHLTNVELLVN